MAEYLKDPKAKVPGTKMIFAGIKDQQKVQDLIAVLKQFDAAGKKAQGVQRYMVLLALFLLLTSPFRCRDCQRPLPADR